MESIILLYVPYPSRDIARGAATSLLTARLVACCNILPAGESLYWWQGAITQAEEVILLAKTTAAHAAAATAHIAAHHPYQSPAILSLPATANAAFTQWVSGELRQG